MKPEQSKQLKIGQRVAWHDSETDRGTVTASDWSGVRIAWDNGRDQFFHHNNMTEIEVARANLARAIGRRRGLVLAEIGRPLFISK
jgi:predicted Zn-dependent protease